MKLNLSYGRHGLTLDIPDTLDVVQPCDSSSLSDLEAAVNGALKAPIGSPPLADLVSPSAKIAVIHTDITRATPNNILLPLLLRHLLKHGADQQKTTLVNSLGTHRRQSEAEQRALLGDWIVDDFPCIQHDFDDRQALVEIGVTSFGTPIKINRTVAEADLVILTGFIEPHFFAGFSGGPKAILPGVASLSVTMANHGCEMISHPNATWGVCEGNPLWEEMLEAARMVRQTFLLNVALNNQNEISAVFAGELYAAHQAGRTYVRQHAMQPVAHDYDFVITTNNGYPLDQNLYQSVKGMSAAGNICRKGGAILALTACEDGLPEHGGYADFLRKAGSPQAVLDLLNSPGFNMHDQWTVQVQALLQQRTDIFVYSEGLSERQIREALFKPCKDPAACLHDMLAKYGERGCVLPRGPMTIPYIQDNSSSQAG